MAMNQASKLSVAGFAPGPRPAPVRLQVLPQHRAVRHAPRIAALRPPGAAPSGG
jgi:hypothetical protein